MHGAVDVGVPSVLTLTPPVAAHPDTRPRHEHQSRPDGTWRVTPPPAPEPDAPTAHSAASASAGGASGGSSAPAVALLFCATLAAMAQLARTLVGGPVFARSVLSVLVVERPG